jgi:hypothetical protein
MSFARLFRVLPLELAARARFWVAQTLPGSILEAGTLGFSSFFAAHARSVQIACDIEKVL